jgi:hypothetical protein
MHQIPPAFKQNLAMKLKTRPSYSLRKPFLKDNGPLIANDAINITVFFFVILDFSLVLNKAQFTKTYSYSFGI